MSKYQFIQVIVRLIGFVLLALSAWSMVGFLSSLVLISKMPAGATSMTGPVVIDAVMKITLEFVVGLYLVIDGSVLFHILNREND